MYIIFDVQLISPIVCYIETIGSLFLGVKMNAQLLSLLFLLACSPKKQEEPKTTVSSQNISIEKEQDCPPGVKTACNVPTMTQEEINAIQEKNKECVQECVQSRQMEAIDHKMIEYQCQESCNQKHFVGQVQVAPSLPLEAPKTENEE